MSTDQVNAVVFAFDERYVGPASVSVSSTLAHLSPDVPIYILGIDLSEKTCSFFKALSSKHKINIIQCGDILENLPSTDRFPLPTWARIYFDKLLPETVKRILYLDSDILVRGTLQQLIDVDLDGFVLGACVDHRVHVHRDRGDSFWRAIHSIPNAGYFNAGVLVIERDKWRELKCEERIKSIAISNDIPLDFFDQDAMNAVLWENWLPLPSRVWNYPGRTIGASRSEAKIVHFLTEPKPWVAPSPVDDFQDEYFSVAKRVGWLEPFSYKMRVRRFIRKLLPYGIVSKRMQL